MAGTNMNIKAFLGAEESSYDDAAALAALTGDDFIPVTKDSTATYKPQIDEVEIAAGGWSGNAGEHVGDMIELALKAPIRPITVSAALTERPDIHALLMACGMGVEAIDESVVVDRDTGSDGDGSTNSFNITIDPAGAGGRPVLDGSVALKAVVGGVTKTITWSATGVVGGDGTGTIDHNAGTITGAAFTAGAPDANTDLTVSFTRAEVVTERIGTGDGTTTPTITSFTRGNINRSSITITCDAQSGSDDGAGALDQDDLATGATLNHTSGTISGTLTWDANTTADAPIIASYTAKKLGPYVVRYTLKPHGHSSMAGRFLAYNSNGAKALAFDATGIRGNPTITATRRKHVILEAALQGLWAGWANTTSIPTLAALGQRRKIAHFKAEAQITAYDAYLQGVDTGNNVTVAGGTGPYTGTLPQVPRNSSVRIYLNGDTGEVFTDVTGSSGVLAGSNGGTGTINYTTGAYSITLGAVPAGTTDIYCDLRYDKTHTGTLLDVKAPTGAFSVNAEESASGTSGYDEISLDPGRPESEVQVRLDLDSFDVRDFAVSQSPLATRITWADPLTRSNSVRLRQVHRIGNDGITVDASARAAVTLKGPLGWGQPDDEGVNGSVHLVDPTKDILSLEFRTDPSLAA